MNKTNYLKFSLIFLLGLFIYSCYNEFYDLPATNLERENLIPKPLSILATNSSFILDKNSSITIPNEEIFLSVGKFLSKKIKDKTQLDIEVNLGKSKNKGGEIIINKVKKNATIYNESYELIISKNSIIVNTQTGEGAFRAIQTIRQLIPYKSSSSKNNLRAIPTGTIIDKPNFEYRGSMLDVARHFFDVEDVKKYIDVMAYYKMNVLHLHLTDDQGWRIEIKSWPELTEIGGFTEVGGGKGGFYTQEQYKEIVAYATQNYIKIIPEIDMPGHTHAASTSYPFLDGKEDAILKPGASSTEKKAALYTGMKVGFSTFKTREEKVYEFIDDVVRELSALTSGEYFHIGGDESKVTKQDDYVYFLKRVEKIVSKYNKTMIGWDEISKADLSTNTVVQFWYNEENAIKSSKKKLKIILSPAKRIYLDIKYDSLSKYGNRWIGYTPIDSSYNWTPEKYIDGISKDQILGIEAPLWSETVSNIQELEYLAFPRLIGVAELGWSIEENRNWENYKVRLANQTPYLNKMKINYYPSKLIDWK
ncbi:MAG: family 20 glycosylhydrolase [Flavobacteriaceae bacterium]